MSPFTPPELKLCGIFLEYNGRIFVEYLEQFKRPGESRNAFIKRIRRKYDPGCIVAWERGRKPDVDTLKEIWWNLRKQGCSFSALMRLAHGIEVREPEIPSAYR